MIQTQITPFKPQKNKILILNQLKLPQRQDWVSCFDHKDVAKAISKMYVRGAPAIGISAAYGFYLGVSSSKSPVHSQKAKSIKKTLDASRPTAVNLFWATDRMYHCFQKYSSEKKDILLKNLYNEASLIHKNDAQRCELMSKKAVKFIQEKWAKDQYVVLTHCNTGALATGGIGTALGVIRYLHSLGKLKMVYATETRPYLQGARLTTYELQKENIPVTLVVDSMPAILMKSKLVDFCIVGADRIAKNGDTANKTGTYALSVLAKSHKIPFFVIAPQSTLDESILTGDDIPIEKRPAEEVLNISGRKITSSVSVLNHSFDITPKKYITKIFHE